MMSHVTESSRGSVVGGASSNEILESNERKACGLQMQRLSLDHAVAPLLSKVAAPFDKTERKKAHTSALYYSECFLRGIQPVDADTAAKDAQEQYDKWWIARTARSKRHSLHVAGHDRKESSSFPASSNHTPPEKIGGKKRRLPKDDASAKSSNIVSVDGSHPDEQTSTKRQHLDAIGLRISFPNAFNRSEIKAAKAELIEGLRVSGGDIECQEFHHCLHMLEAYYRSRNWDGRGSCKETPFSLEGNWLTLSRPDYDESMGRNQKGDLLYTLGRMSFGMFRPTNLVCSLQASFNTVRRIDPKNPGRPLHVPKKLMKEIHAGNTLLRSYDIVVAITIEPGQDRRGIMLADGGQRCEEYVVPKPIRAILTNQGYAVPDPDVPNRLSIWFSGGDLEVQDEPADLEEWQRIFDSDRTPERNLREYANILAARLLLGALLPEEMADDGTMTFTLKKPIGGHGTAYCDVLYMDDDLRITRGHSGSIYVCSRVPEPEHIII
mmetsp:Transcript_56690/g.164420  ORF Transcript_56690/g.164420 Transcript_56690/m.164420 type:complete len:494 (-) Transcript_56690:598-2079(-)